MVDRAICEVTCQTKKNKDTPGGKREFIDSIACRLAQEKGQNTGLKGRERGPSQDP